MRNREFDWVVKKLESFKITLHIIYMTAHATVEKPIYLFLTLDCHKCMHTVLSGFAFLIALGLLSSVVLLVSTLIKLKISSVEKHSAVHLWICLLLELHFRCIQCCFTAFALLATPTEDTTELAKWTVNDMRDIAILSAILIPHPNFRRFCVQQLSQSIYWVGTLQKGFSRMSMQHKVQLGSLITIIPEVMLPM